MNQISEELVDLAERYAEALRQIEELEGALHWDDDDVELAERYAAALKQIEEH